MNYELDIEIDESALDIEWLNQPKLALTYGKHWALLTRQLSALNEKRQVLKAELTDKINQDIEGRLGKGVKPTVGNIDSYILQHEAYKTLIKEIREMEYEVNVANIAKSEISHSRKTALENLVRLHGLSYFAGPNMPRDLNNEVDRRAEKELQQKQANGRVKLTRKR